MKHGLFKFGLLALSLSAASLIAQSARAGVWSADGGGCDFSGERFGQRFIVADFNNDQKPDSITLRSFGQTAGQNQFGLRVCASGGTASLLTIKSSESSIVVTVIDVNQDGSPDIVVEQRYTQRRIQVWLNDGRGEFHKAEAGDFEAEDTQAPCKVSAPSDGRHNSPRRAHLRRGNKLSIQKADLPTICSYVPSRYHGSLLFRVLKDLGGPNISRAPPSALHL